MIIDGNTKSEVQAEVATYRNSIPTYAALEQIKRDYSRVPFDKPYVKKGQKTNTDAKFLEKMADLKPTSRCTRSGNLENPFLEFESIHGVSLLI